jgi:hypothetical protein
LRNADLNGLKDVTEPFLQRNLIANTNLVAFLSIYNPQSEIRNYQPSVPAFVHGSILHHKNDARHL